MKNKNDKARVIVTYGRSLMALTAAHSLGKRGVEVIGCDDVDMTVLSFSRHVSDYFIHAPYQSELEQYLDDLEENIRKFKPKDDRPYILMPMFRDAKILAQHRARFEPLIEIAAPLIDTIDKVDPKDVFAQTCEKLGLDIPKTYQTQNLEELENIKDQFEYPILIKPKDGMGGRGICKAKSFEELQSLYNKSTTKTGCPPLVQEVIEGEDYCLATLCDHGKIVARMAYKNLYQYPRESGAGIMRETIKDDAFFETAQKLLGALKWHGLAQIDFRWSGNAKDPAYLIEVNPRFWAGLYHSVKSGVDFPWLLYQLTAEGKVTEQSEVIIGKKTKIPGLWTLSALQEIADSETHFDNLKQTWMQTWDSNNDAQWRDRFKNLGNAIRHSIDAKDIVAKIKEMHTTGRDAQSELDNDDDPFTSLGFLFIASSLIRHGELPPELKG